MKIDYDTTDFIRTVIEGIGRTEDVKFSPDNKAFVIPEFLANKLHIFYFAYNGIDESPGIFISGYSLVKSDYLKNPHGICFVGNGLIAVCNREGDVTLFRVPGSQGEFDIKPEAIIDGSSKFFARVRTPGSVDAYQIDGNHYKILVCNNYFNTVTAHIIETAGDVKVEDQGVLIRDSLLLPDGISISPDNRWIAVSNHVYGQVLIYENTHCLNSETPPSNVLVGPVCPHGIRFSPDGNFLYVADASSQYLYVYKCNEGNWNQDRETAATVRMMDDDTFHMGRYSTREGGVKGIDVDTTNSIMVTTHRMEVIAFFDMSEINSGKDEADPEEIKEFYRQRDDSLKDAVNDLKKNGSLRSFSGKAVKHIYLRTGKSVKKIRQKLSLGYLQHVNNKSKEAVTDTSGPALSLASQGDRLDTVHYTLESI